MAPHRQLYYPNIVFMRKITGMAEQGHDVTRALIDASAGNEAASNRLWMLAYDELKRIAMRQLRGERSGHTLSATALVHEAYFKLVDQTRVSWQGRAHFYGVAAQAMRRILVSYARSRKAIKRGGDNVRVTLDEELNIGDDRVEELIALDDAMKHLSKLNERLSLVVELRYFGGLNTEEIAEILEVSPRTIERDWVKAKGWLFQELYRDGN